MTHLFNASKRAILLSLLKLDRFARFATEGLSLINNLLARGVHVFILNMGLIDNTPTSKLITTILLAIDEFERDMIIKHTQADKEIACSKNGFRDGRPSIDQKKKDFVTDIILNKHKSYNEVVELTGLSKSAVTRAVRHAKANLIHAKNNEKTRRSNGSVPLRIRIGTRGTFSFDKNCPVGSTKEELIIDRDNWDDVKMFSGIFGMVTSKLFDREFLS